MESCCHAGVSSLKLKGRLLVSNPRSQWHRMNVASMSIKELKEEIAALGGSAEGCFERQDIEGRLIEIREKQSGRGGAICPAQPPAVETDFIASLTSSFNSVGDNFGLMMKRVSDKFDQLDNKLDDLENKRGQLRKTLSKEAETPLGRLNQLKAASAAHTFDEELEKAKALGRAEREKIDKELAEKAYTAGSR